MNIQSFRIWRPLDPSQKSTYACRSHDQITWQNPGRGEKTGNFHGIGNPRYCMCLFYVVQRIRAIVVRYSSRRISSKCFFLKLLKFVCKTRSTKSCRCAIVQRDSLCTALPRKFINIYFAVALLNLNVRNCSVINFVHQNNVAN